MKKGLVKKLGCLVLTLAITVSGISVVQPIEVSAAPKVKSIGVKTSSSFLGSKKTLYVGGPKSYRTTKLVVSIKPAKASKKVKYTSSKKSVATVSSKGTVKAKKTGSTYITVQSKSNKSKKKKIKIIVKKYVYPKKITLKAGKSLNGGRKLTIKKTFSPAKTTDKKVTFTSSNKSLATVNSKGVVTANKNNKTGTVTIRVKGRAKNSKKKIVKKSIKIKILKKVEASSVKMSSSVRTMVITGTNSNPTSYLTATISPLNTYSKKIAWTSSNTRVATVSKGKITAKRMGVTTITAKANNGKYATCKVTVKKNTVAVHDPSIVKGTDNKYYIFGSHMAWAKTNTLTGWNTFSTNINTNYATLFKSCWDNWANFNKDGKSNLLNDGVTANALSGNLWAPDVIYNKTMKKWCMYMSVNGPDNNSVIALATADKIDGPYTYVGDVVYSGFGNSKHPASKTDAPKVLGKDADFSVYRTRDKSGGGDYRLINAIDPGLEYDEDGNLWMVYGSWFGGLYMLKIDSKTGLRDYSKTYTTQKDVSDAYYGVKIAGGYECSGEAPYIMKSGDYYYLFVTNGGLAANGGYNMRLYRSKKITGPYVDAQGQTAINARGTSFVNTTGTVGIRLMAGYKMPGQVNGYLAQGHNSAFVDSDGKMYLVYHTRFENRGEQHEVRVHQMFMNADGWLCVAPFEYNGETISKTGYAKKDIVGTYDFMIQYPGQKNGTAATTVPITLGDNGVIGGVKNGSWTYISGSSSVTMYIDGVTYKGVFLKQTDESDNRNELMTFTLVGDDNVCIWGSKQVTSVTDKIAVTADKDYVSIGTTAEEDFFIPTLGKYGSKITWKSSNTDVIRIDGTNARITRTLDLDTTAELTATITRGKEVQTKKYTVTVKKVALDIPSVITENIELVSKLGDYSVTWASSNKELISLDGVVKRTLIDENVTLTATLTKNGVSVERVFTPIVKKLTLDIPSEASENIQLVNQLGDYTVTWNSTNTDIIALDGTVKRGIVDQSVTLTATLTKNGISVEQEFTVLVKELDMYIPTVIKSSFVELPSNLDGYTVTWESSDLSVININGTVNQPASGSVKVTLTATIDDTIKRVYEVTVFSTVPDTYIYQQDYEGVSDILSIWESEHGSNFLSLQKDAIHGSYAQFAPVAVNSRGALTSFGIETGSVYMVEFDAFLQAGDNQNTNFAISGKDMKYYGNSNDGIDSGYILKLDAPAKSTVWTISGTSSNTTVDIPQDWVHFSVAVDKVTKNATVTISNGDTVYYEGVVAISGTGDLNGLYTRAGRYNPVIKVDNIKVY